MLARHIDLIARTAGVSMQNTYNVLLALENVSRVLDTYPENVMQSALQHGRPELPNAMQTEACHNMFNKLKLSPIRKGKK